MKIIDFDHGVGGLTNGLEMCGDFEVIEAPFLNNINSLCYNLNHKNLFEIGKYKIDGEYDIANFVPSFGEGFLRRGAKNFDFSEINKIFDFIEKYTPKIVVICTIPEVIQFLEEKQLNYTIDGWPMYDTVLSKLNNHYNVFQFVIDGADYGVPQHKKKNFYLCIRRDIPINEFSMPKRRYSIKKGFVSIRDAIGDIEGSEYIEYKSEYIQFCKKDNPQRLTWHDFNYRSQETCSHIYEGSSARKTSDVSQVTGYIRPKYDKICPNLSFDFYRVSSKKASIHPSQNRPFSIREGARLFGLPDTYVWNSNLSNKIVANEIYNSISPIFGIVLGEILQKII